MSMFTSFWVKYGQEIVSVSKGAAIAAAGAGLDVVLRYVIAIDIDPVYIPLEVAALSVFVNIVRKFGIPVTKFLIGRSEV